MQALICNVNTIQRSGGKLWLQGSNYLNGMGLFFSGDMHFSLLLGGILNESAHYLDQKRVQINFTFSLLRPVTTRRPVFVLAIQYGTCVPLYRQILACLDFCHPTSLPSPYPNFRAMALHIKSRGSAACLLPSSVGGGDIAASRLVSLSYITRDACSNKTVPVSLQM